MKHLTCAVRGLPANTTKEMVEENFNFGISPESRCTAHLVTDETQDNSRAATVTFRNEKKGRKRSCETLRKEFDGSKWRGTSSTISVVHDFMGLMPLSGAADSKIQYVLFSRLISFCADMNVACTLSMALAAMLSEHGALMRMMT